MQLVKVEEAKAGSKVAKDVIDPKGNLLLKKDTVLTDDILQKVKNRNVTHLIIEDSNASSLTEEQIKQKEDEIDKSLDDMFNGTLENPLMASLLQATKTVLKRKIK